MILLDFFFYKLTNFYKLLNKGEDGEGYGIIMTCAFPFWNLTVLLIYIDYYFSTNLLPENKYYLLLYSLPFVSFILLRYCKIISYNEINIRIYRKTKFEIFLLNSFFILYVITTLLGLASVVYIAKQIHG